MREAISRHHAAKHGVAVDLRQYLIGEHFPPVAHNGHGRFIATGFKANMVALRAARSLSRGRSYKFPSRI